MESGRLIAQVAPDLSVNDGTHGNRVGKGREAAGGADAARCPRKINGAVGERYDGVVDLLFSLVTGQRAEDKIPIRMSCRAFGVKVAVLQATETRSAT